MQNSLDNRQAISDALEESFATIDFGPETSFSSSDEECVPNNNNNNIAIENSINLNDIPTLPPPPLPDDEIVEPEVNQPEVNKQLISTDLSIPSPAESVEIEPSSIIENYAIEQLPVSIISNENNQFNESKSELTIVPKDEPSEIEKTVEKENPRIEIIERVTSVDESVTPYVDNVQNVDNELGLEYEPKSLLGMIYFENKISMTDILDRFFLSYFFEIFLTDFLKEFLTDF